MRVALDTPEVAGGVVEAREFAFDGVFPGGASQEDVFREVGLPALEECLKGFNCAVLAYGQTGSGKTHSLLHRGRPGAVSPDAGLLPRIIVELFDRAARDAAEAGAVYEISAAALQVYNEHVDDLLHAGHQGGSGLNLDVRSGGDIPGLTWVQCKRAEALKKAFNRARANLVYAETWMNKASSRSHAVFQIRIARRSADTPGRCIVARLSVVDLAGSERVKKSGVEGVHLKEATAINKSLLALGNVVSALAAKSAFVPFRDSKLTRILDGSIGGNCKTALLVCVSSATEHAQETMSSLEFASRALHIEVNARVNAVVEFEFGARLREELPAASDDESVSLEEQLAEALERAARAEARAEAAERAAAEWQERAAQCEADSERARRETVDSLQRVEEELASERQKAAAALARLRERGDRSIEALEARLAQLGLEAERNAFRSADAWAQLERVVVQTAEREAALLKRLEEAEEAGRRATEVAEHFKGAEAAALEAERVAQEREVAAEAREAVAQERVAELSDVAAAVEQKGAALQVDFDAALERERARVEAQLRAGQESLEARLAEARQRGAAELARRMRLVEGREEDARKIKDQSAKLEAQRSELCQLVREVESLRRGGRGGQPYGGTGYPGGGGTSAALPTLLGSHARTGPAARKNSRPARKLVGSRSAAELGGKAAQRHGSSGPPLGRLSLAGAATLLPPEKACGSSCSSHGAATDGTSSRASSTASGGGLLNNASTLLVPPTSSSSGGGISASSTPSGKTSSALVAGAAAAAVRSIAGIVPER